VLRLLLSFVSLVSLVGVAGCIAPATYAPRPYRFESRAPVPQETQLVAQRMSGRPGLKPVFVDPNTGTVLAAWSGPQSSATVSPLEGARAWYRVQRYRAFVRPNGWGSSVFVDVEQLECDQRGFQWTEAQIFGSCRPITNVTAQELRTLDQTAASLASFGG
jgi:hypothetical protein